MLSAHLATDKKKSDNCAIVKKCGTSDSIVID